eukprot:6182716-Pleurochrysis_carterae.AAC.1
MEQVIEVPAPCTSLCERVLEVEVKSCCRQTLCGQCAHLHLADHARRVLDLRVGSRVAILLQEISVDQPRNVDLDHISPLKTEVGRDKSSNLLVEPRAVFVVHETVAEDAQILVSPQSDKICTRNCRFWVGGEEALEDGGNVAQVERVVRLRRSRQKLLEEHFVQIDARLKPNRAWQCRKRNLTHMRPNRQEKPNGRKRAHEDRT